MTKSASQRASESASQRVSESASQFNPLETQNSKPETQNSKLETQNSKPETQNPKPETLTKLSISAFFPAYNDAGTIASMVLTVLLTLRELSDDYEVIVVNDGSGDHTPLILDELARVYPGEVRIIHHAKNRGYGGALRSGFTHATKEWIFYTDGDAQYDPRELKHLVAMAGPEVDFINGWKIERNDPLHRIIIGRIYQYLIKFTFRLRLKDVDCDFRLMRRAVFDKVYLTSDSGVICVELMKKTQDTGFRLAETPVHHYHRAYGKSQFFNYPRLVRTGRDLLKLWWRLVVRRE